MTTNQDTLAALAQCAYRIRRYALRMGEVQGQGYIGQALGLGRRAGRRVWPRAEVQAR